MKILEFIHIDESTVAQIQEITHMTIRVKAKNLAYTWYTQRNVGFPQQRHLKRKDLLPYKGKTIILKASVKARKVLRKKVGNGSYQINCFRTVFKI